MIEPEMLPELADTQGLRRNLARRCSPVVSEETVEGEGGMSNSFELEASPPRNLTNSVTSIKGTSAWPRVEVCSRDPVRTGTPETPRKVSNTSKQQCDLTFDGILDYQGTIHHTPLSVPTPFYPVQLERNLGSPVSPLDAQSTHSSSKTEEILLSPPGDNASEPASSDQADADVGELPHDTSVTNQVQDDDAKTRSLLDKPIGGPPQTCNTTHSIATCSHPYSALEENSVSRFASMLMPATKSMEETIVSPLKVNPMFTPFIRVIEHASQQLEDGTITSPAELERCLVNEAKVIWSLTTTKSMTNVSRTIYSQTWFYICDS